LAAESIRSCAWRTCLAAALLAAGLAAPASSKDWSIVRIGTDATSPPFETVDSRGEFVGWEIEYGRALCARLHVTCTIQNQDWDGIIPALLGGKFDVILSGMSITPQRQKMVLFSAPYYQSLPVFIGHAGDGNDDVSPAALKGKAIGAQSSTIFADYLERFYKGSDIKLYPGGNDANLELADGRLDYAMNDNVGAEAFLATIAHGCCRVVATLTPDPAIFGTGVGAAFRRQDMALCAMFNRAIAELFADGTYERIEKRYFTVDVRPRGGP
jgi:polar amino acid transport system substrate-binding protein